MQIRVGKDRRGYNIPHHDEVAVVFVGKDGAPPMERAIVVYPRDQPLLHVSYMSANCVPMIYPILFPRGNPGWHCDLKHVSKYSTEKGNQVAMLQFYADQLAICKEFNHSSLKKTFSTVLG